MTEDDVHKCLLSYGCLPVLIILREKELEGDFLVCAQIKNSIESYKKRFPYFESEFETQWSQKAEDTYYSYFSKLAQNGELLARKNMVFYLNDIRKRLKLWN